MQDTGLNGAERRENLNLFMVFLDQRPARVYPQSFIQNSLLPLIFAPAIFRLKRVSQNLKIL